MRKTYLSLVYIAVTALAGCSSFQGLESGQHQPNLVTSQSNRAIENELLSSYARYKGVPYRFGGTDANGFDCSGFINVVYDEVFDIDLPRETDQIIRAGKAIRRDQLRSGDIVFFQTSAKQLHAGIYTGNDQFIHASTSKGVIQSSLDNQYWRQRYLQSRRY